MTKSTVLESSDGTIAGNMLAIGLMVNSMVLDLIPKVKKKIPNKEFGNMEKF